METVLRTMYLRVYFLFKSYYVVWKLVKNPKILGSTISFKSYYVVWKPFRNYMVFEKTVEFKSYYVVWKRTSVRIRNIHIAGGLNRTM